MLEINRLVCKRKKMNKTELETKRAEKISQILLKTRMNSNTPPMWVMRYSFGSRTSDRFRHHRAVRIFRSLYKQKNIIIFIE